MNKYKVEIKWALIFVITALLWFLFEKLMGWHGANIEKHATNTLFFMPIAFFIYFLALREKKASLDGGMTWKQGFITGIIIGFIVALFSPLSQYIVHTLISPDYFDTVIKYTLDTQPDVTEESLRSFFNLKSYIKMATLQAPIAGAITAAILSLFLKNK